VVCVPLVVREDLQGGTRRGLLSVFLHKQYIHSCRFYLWGSVNKFLNFCVAHLPCCFLKITIKISHSHFVHVAFVSILVFQTFDRMIFGTLTFPGTRWYVITVQDTQMVHDQKKFENHCITVNNSWPHGRPQKFFQVEQHRHFAAYPFQVAIDAMQMDVHKTLYPFSTTKKMPRVTATITKMHFVGSPSPIYYDHFHHRLCSDFENCTFFHNSIAMVFNETTNYNYLPRKTCQRHLETSAANVRDLVQSDQSPFQKPCLSLIFHGERSSYIKLTIHKPDK